MKPHAATLVLGALAAAGCSHAGSSPDRPGESAQPSESLQSPSIPNAIRFLEQSSFGPTPAGVDHVTAVGIPQAITDQMAQPTSYYSYGYYTQLANIAAPTVTSCSTDTDCGAATSGLVCNAGTCAVGCRGTGGNACPAGDLCTSTTSALGACQQHVNFDPGTLFFVHALSAPDQLRQRVAFTLSQIWVVSQVNFVLTSSSTTGTFNAPVHAYLNKLADDAFVNYRQIMYDMTVNAAMGSYLNMANNLGVNSSGVKISPNENYGRELMQLFTLGVIQLDETGTPLSGNPPTYGQDIVEAMSHVLTGWTYGNATNTCPARGHTQGGTDYALPMIPCDVNHDNTPQQLFVLPAGSSPNPAVNAGITPGTSALADLNFALDNLFYHPNLPPFVCKQLIQHLVTSNPSKAYVQRVVNVFKNDGSGRPQTRGNMDSVIRAILQDDEARGPVPTFADQPTFGRLRPPALFITNVLRWLSAVITDPTTLVTSPNTQLDATTLSTINAAGTVNAWSSNMGQYVSRPPTVFSYYPPGAPLPGSTTLVGPEFGIENTGTAMARANFLDALVLSKSGASGVGGITINLNDIPPDPAALVQWLDANMLHGAMSPGLESIVLTAVSDPTVPTSKVVPLGIYLVAISPEYQTQR